MSIGTLIRLSAATLALAALAGCMEMQMLGGKDQYGEISTFNSRVSEKIYPAYIAEVDGDNVNTTAALGRGTVRHVFRLEPGRHTIRVVADFSRVEADAQRGIYTPRDEEPGDIEIFVEEGRKYHLGAKLVGQRTDEWEPVVWKVEDIEGYDHTIVE